MELKQQYQMRKQLTMASLFDGSGGFPLAATLCGIKPIWASEVEPFPIRVTTKRFPDMKHYGNVCDINGADVEPVDIITFGSPCQDLSIAGKRAGLEGERSNLFYEALRIIKEMREATNDKYPRYAVWENVPGAFSSNKGADFLCVLRGFADCAKAGISIPKPEKWNKSGGIVDYGFSLAWRVLDAQFWGVPQRRKRIFLVADFAGSSAWEILFKSESVSGHYKQVQKAWEELTGRAGGCAEEAGINCVDITCGNFQCISKDKTPAITSTHKYGIKCYSKTTRPHNKDEAPTIKETEVANTCNTFDTGDVRTNTFVCQKVYDNHSQDSRYNELDSKSNTLTSRIGTGGGNLPLVVPSDQKLYKSGQDAKAEEKEL